MPAKLLAISSLLQGLAGADVSGQLHALQIQLCFALGIVSGKKGPFQGVFPGAEKKQSIDDRHPVAAKMRGLGAVLCAFAVHGEISLVNVAVRNTA